MRILFGELRPTFKSIRIDGTWHEQLTRKHVVYLPQYCSKPKKITVGTAFDDFGIDYQGFCNVFPEFEHYRDYKVRDLSGGVQRVIETYLVLMSEAEFVMLNEPFSQITLLDIEKIKQLILKEKERKGILVTDHMYRNILDITDELYVLADQTIYQARSDEDLVRLGYVRQL